MQIKTDHGIKLGGIYPGKVIQHLDAGKCKIFIPGVYPDSCLENPDTVPDAEQAGPLFGGINNGNGCFSYPNIGAVVWCMFQNGDQNYPVYFASRLGGYYAASSTEEGFGSVRDNVNPDDDPEKDTTKNGEDSQCHLIRCGDSMIKIWESGQILINCDYNQGDDEEEGEEGHYSQIFLDGTGTIQINTTNTIEINSPAIKISTQQFELNAKTTVIRSDDELQINSKQFASVNDNKFMVISPQIGMDASKGTFTALSKNHAPFYMP